MLDMSVTFDVFSGATSNTERLLILENMPAIFVAFLVSMPFRFSEDIFEPLNI